MLNNIASCSALLNVIVHQIGPRPNRRIMRDMFISREELPPGEWTAPFDTVYRIARSKNALDEGVRARMAHGITGKRLLRTLRNDRSVQVFMVFMASEEDASSYAPKMVDILVRMPFSHQRTGLMKHAVLAGEVGLPPALSIVEWSYTSRLGSLNERYVSGGRSNVAFSIDFQAVGGTWSWEDVSSISMLQIENIDRGASELREATTGL